MNKHSFLAAAVSGILLGSALPAVADDNGSGGGKSKNEPGQGDKHTCKGKNACKGHGGCKTDKHACKGKNACKGQGGCKAA